LTTDITASKLEPYDAKAPRALVVFSGQTDLSWLRVLRPGYRHCFVLIECAPLYDENVGGGWVLYNPLSNATQIAVWALRDEQTVRAWLSEQGYTVVETYVRPLTARVLPWRPFTCVEAVKRALGLHEHKVFTPYQLYKILKKDNYMKKVLDISVGLGY